MKKLKKFLFAAFTVAILSCLLCQPAFAAISESDVQAQVDAVGKEAVSGNVFIWFLCAIGFLKVGQKIDSFLSSLGVNVGHTGGSMLAAAMIELFQSPLWRREEQQFHQCQRKRW